MAVPAALSVNQAEFEFEAGPYAASELHVVGWQATEQISRPFELTLELAAADDADIDLEKVVDKDAMLTIHLGMDETRRIRGIVREIRAWDAGSGAGRRRYHATVVPALWRLEKVRRSRVFQKVSVLDILKQVLGEWKIAHRLSLRGSDGKRNYRGSYGKRNYCVQYGETDLAFLSRLCEEEGILFYFEHDKDKHAVVFADDSTALPPIPGESSELSFRPTSGMAAAGEAVLEIERSHRVQPGAVMLRDFRFHQPSLDLDAKASADGADPALEIYEYPGEYPSPVIGKALAKVRLEELRAEAKVSAGKTSSRRLSAGHLFELRGHEDGAHNQKYLIRSVEHVGRQLEVLPHFTPRPQDAQLPAYQAMFVSQPASVPFRPARTTPRPTSGIQTAVVVGPKGEEIYTDKHGRIKVQFHWDREGKNNEGSSCWIRVAQSWAGAGWGALQIPRIGQEVVVDFLDGDPDRPLVTGRVYNGHNPPSGQLPGDGHKSGLRSSSTPGGGGSNEIQFDDSNGSEKFYQHAQKDLSIVIGKDKTQEIGGNETLTVTKNRTKVVHGNQFLTVSKNDHVKVGGAQSIAVVKDRSVTVGGSHNERVTGTQTVAVDGNHSLTIGIGSIESVGAAKALTVGGGYATTVGGVMMENVGGAKVETVGAAKIEQVGAKKSESVVGNRVTSVKGALTEDVGKDYKVTVRHDFVANTHGKLNVVATETHSVKAKELTISAEDSLTINVGSVSVLLKKDGDAVLKASKVKISAKGNVVIKGSKIQEN